VAVGVIVFMVGMHIFTPTVTFVRNGQDTRSTEAPKKYTAAFFILLTNALEGDVWFRNSVKYSR